MVTPNAMRAASPSIIRRCIPTRAPRRQTPPRTKRQLQIRLLATTPHLAPRRWLPPRPHNTLARAITRLDAQRTPIKPIPKHIRKIIPHRLAIEIIRKDCLADIRLEQAALYGCDLQRNAARGWVPVEDFAVGSVGGDDYLRVYAAANGPEVERFGALICDDCATEGEGEGEDGEEKERKGGEEVHCE